MPKNIFLIQLFAIVIGGFLLILLPLLIPPMVQAVPFTLAEWNFEDAIPNQTADAGITANLTKIITRENSYLYTYTYPNGFNNIGNAFSSTHWDNGVDLKYWQIEFNTSGYQSLTISSKQRSSGTGPKDFRLQYSLDNGTTWLDIPGSSFSLLSDTWNSSSISNISLPSECDNQNSVVLRWVLSSLISANNGIVASGGTNRIDDIIITGSELDTDNDGISDSLDNCPNTANPDQIDTDSDGKGDNCDNCPLIANSDQADSDSNGIGDACESPSPSPSFSPSPSPSPLSSPSPSISSPPSPSPITPELFCSITGFVFYDTNKNNHWDGLFKGEFKLGGWKIFIDANENSKFDKGEKFTLTNLFSLKFFGQYSFAKLTQSNYRICEILLPGWSSSLPDQSNCQVTILAGGENKVGVNFGNYFSRLKF